MNNKGADQTVCTRRLVLVVRKPPPPPPPPPRRQVFSRHSPLVNTLNKIFSSILNKCLWWKTTRQLMSQKLVSEQATLAAILRLLFLAHLSQRLRGELFGYLYTAGSGVHQSSVRQHFQTSSLKPLGQLKSNFIWRLIRMEEQKFVQMVLVTWPR